MVYIFHMSPEISTLGEGLPTTLALEGSLARVLAEVVPEVAAFLEDRVAPLVHTAEVQLDPLCLLVANLDRLVQVRRDGVEGSRLAGALRHDLLALEELLKGQCLLPFELGRPRLG